MRKPSNCAHAFQIVNSAKGKSAQTCMDCKKILFKWQKEVQIADLFLEKGMKTGKSKRKR